MSALASRRGTAVEVDPLERDAAMRVNVTSMMLMAKYAIPEMRKAGGGSIINIASVAGLTGGHPSLLYPTSKGAVVQMTRAMASHHGAKGIRVNCIAPGMVYTPMVYSRGMSEELRDQRRRRSLLQVEGTGWDVGNGVLYLASEEARCYWHRAADRCRHHRGKRAHSRSGVARTASFGLESASSMPRQLRARCSIPGAGSKKASKSISDRKRGAPRSRCVEQSQDGG